MRTVLFTAIVVLFLTLDWAALHDIVKGEPNLFAEYGMLTVSLVVFAALIFNSLRKKSRNSNPA
ncbi:MAG: hypothetical protein ACE5HO_05840 [bacterium]